MENRQYSLKEKLGAAIYDLPLYARCLATDGGWVKLKNRRDEIALGPDQRGVVVSGDWSSDLYACDVFPGIGRCAMRKALAQWPLAFADARQAGGRPNVTFVIPFRGSDRLAQLRQVVRSILGQRGVSVQCLVVEQNNTREANDLPAGAEYLHLPDPSHSTEWRKSWAFNVGVGRAAADIVVCHDADILVPEHYAREILRRVDQGYEAMHLQRFLFCLDRRDTERCLASGNLIRNATPERIRQNWQGGTLAITKNAFQRIGGYDESFVGWGGEDNEFFDRCRAVKQWTHGFLPFVHLWHPPQDAKSTTDRDDNLRMLEQRLAIDRKIRVEQLGKR